MVDALELLLLRRCHPSKVNRLRLIRINPFPLPTSPPSQCLTHLLGLQLNLGLGTIFDIWVLLFLRLVLFHLHESVTIWLEVPDHVLFEQQIVGGRQVIVLVVLD